MSLQMANWQVKLFGTPIKPVPTPFPNTILVNSKYTASWGQFGDWTDCTVSCGGGTQTRTQVCNDPVPDDDVTCTGEPNSVTRPCNNAPCPGEL